MTGPDLLESGSARPPSRTSRRRLAGFAAILALVAGAVVLADPEPPAARPTPVPAISPPVQVIRDPPYYLYDVTVANDHVYALAGACADTRTCGYRLLAWDGEHWTSTPMRIPAAADLPGRLLVTGAGGKFLAVLDGTRPGAYVSADGGRSFGVRPGRTGPAIGAVPAGLVPELGESGVGLFDPVAGLWRPLATQPMAGIRSVAATGRTLRAVARQGTALVVATSTDAGRTWTRTTVTRVTYRTPELQLVPSADGSAYLVVTRPLAAGEPGVAAIWRGGKAWTPVADFRRQIGSTPRFSNAVATPTGGILLADGSTGGVLAYDTGTEIVFAVPPGADGDPPLIPVILRSDAAGTVAAITADGGHLLVRRTSDASWTVVRLPA